MICAPTLASPRTSLTDIDHFWEKEQTKADVEVFILNEIYAKLPSPPFSPKDKEAAANRVYTHVWQQTIAGTFAEAA